MVFTSHVFLFYFLPLTLLAYYGLVAMRVNLSWINLVVTIASYAFYGWFQPYFVILMFITTAVNYYCGKAIAAQGATRFQRNTALTVSVVISLGFLGFFKYYMFFMGGVNRVAEIFSGNPNLFHVMMITLPIGISFYTFQAMSYTIDVWRGDAPPVKDLMTFSAFVALFPQLIAGPIIRYNTVAEQLADRRHTLDKFGKGSLLFMLGFAKKIILANSAGEVANMVFHADSPDAASAWVGILAYHFQIYFDFCAYSDMAVGLGRMMGFEYIKNFNGPYLSKSISDFWNRWHISLSTWIKDYLYISLGGNRKGVKRTYINLGIAMFLCGLWHGAQITFVVWGIFHGALLIWERTMRRRPIYEKLHWLPKIILTNVIVMTGWVVFRAPSFDQAIVYWKSMAGLAETIPATRLLHAQVFQLEHVVGILLCSIFVFQPFQAHDIVNRLNSWKVIVIIAVFVFSIATMFNQTFNPFLYFQF